MIPKKPAFVNGTFDILHPGHIALLQYAAELTNRRVTVAIDSDHRVTSMKGPDRPFFNAGEREFMLKALSSVGKVLVFNNDYELEGIIKGLAPDIMVVGSDWKDKKVIGAEHAGELVYFDRLEEYSTTKILQGPPYRGVLSRSI